MPGSPGGSSRNRTIADEPCTMNGGTTSNRSFCVMCVTAAIQQNLAPPVQPRCCSAPAWAAWTSTARAEAAVQGPGPDAALHRRLVDHRFADQVAQRPLADHWVDRAAHRLTGLLQRSAGQAEQDA